MRSLLLRRVLPPLLAILVLLAQSLAYMHRSAHPNANPRAAALSSPSPSPSLLCRSDCTSDARVVAAGASLLDKLFGHAAGTACDDFDAALGLDLNPAHPTLAVVASLDEHVIPIGFSSPAPASFPAGLSLARAPPGA
ncbi:MAG TPA: hypothetical protein VF928_09600 [Usitatibacteraceae bacterium]